MAIKKVIKKKVVAAVKEKAKAALRGKGKAQIVYFPADKLQVLEKALKKANGNGISKVIIEALEKTL